MADFPPLTEVDIPSEWQNAHDELMREVLHATTGGPNSVLRASFASFASSPTSDQPHDAATANGHGSRVDLAGAFVPPGNSMWKESVEHNDTSMDSYLYGLVDDDCDYRPTKMPGTTGRNEKDSNDKDDEGDDLHLLHVERGISRNLFPSEETAALAGAESVHSPAGPVEELDNVMDFYPTGLVPNVISHFAGKMEQMEEDFFFDSSSLLPLEDPLEDAMGHLEGSGDSNTTLDGMLAMVADVDGDVDMMDNDDDDDSRIIAGLPYAQRYKATFEKLQASLKRSQETRKCLSIKTIKTEQYDRIASVDGVLSSIKASSSQLQKVVAKSAKSPISQRQVI